MFVPADWTVSAACRDEAGRESGADWFADAGTAPTQQAVLICASCSVQEDCLSYALQIEERFGVWGGLTPAQREALAAGAAREQVVLITRTYPRRRRGRQNGSSAGVTVR